MTFRCCPTPSLKGPSPTKSCTLSPLAVESCATWQRLQASDLGLQELPNDLPSLDLRSGAWSLKPRHPRGFRLGRVRAKTSGRGAQVLQGPCTRGPLGERPAAGRSGSGPSLGRLTKRSFEALEPSRVLGPPGRERPSSAGAGISGADRIGPAPGFAPRPLEAARESLSRIRRFVRGMTGRAPASSD